MTSEPRRVRAPGKLMLLGEYAVLDGAPALVQAVGNGVGCVRTPAEALAIHTPRGDERFVRAALLAADAPPARYHFYDIDPLGLPGKPGLGGSAAAVVAALLAAGLPRDQLLPAALRVHHQVQGSGSGADVAASALGGTVRFEHGRARRCGEALPAPLVLWTGASARTGPRVERYLSWRERDAFVQRSAQLVDAFAEDPVAVVREAWRLLCDATEAAGVAYRTPAIDQAVALAEAHGGAAKPSGAGGGDVVVAWVTDADAYRAALKRAGLSTLDVQPAGPPTA